MDINADMTTLILASELTAGTPKIRDLVANEPKGLILIIPTASRGEGWEPIYEKHYQPFEEMGYTTEEFDLNGKTPAEVAEKLGQASAIYVCGGNTFVLLEHMRKSGFADQIAKRIEEGLVYIGSSAGVVAATPDIMYAAALDDPSKADLKSFEGLNLLPYAVIPHMDHVDYGGACKSLYDRMVEKGYRVQPLNDDQVIHVKGDQITIV